MLEFSSSFLACSRLWNLIKFQIKAFWIFNRFLERLSLKRLYFIKSTKILIFFSGVAFWTASAREFYATPNTEFVKLSEYSDEISSTSRKHHRASNYNCNESQDWLAGEIREMKAEIVKFTSLLFSLSFISAFEEAFQCCISKQNPANPPIIACWSCSALVGCEACTNDW